GLLGVVWVAGFNVWFRDTPREHPGVNEAERALIEGDRGLVAKPAPLSWDAMLRSPTLWVLCLMYFCSNAGWGFFITWDVRFHERVLHLSGWELSLAAGAPLIFGGVGCLLGGFTTDLLVGVLGRRWGRTLQGLIAYLLSGTFFLLALATTQPLLVVAAL